MRSVRTSHLRSRPTLAAYFPRCEDASLILIPAPGASPIELTVAGDVLEELGMVDDWQSTSNGRYWKTEAAG